MSSMSPLTDDDLSERIGSSEQVRRYTADVDRESAREILAGRVAEPVRPSTCAFPTGRSNAPRAPSARAGRKAPSALLGTSCRRRY